MRGGGKAYEVGREGDLLVEGCVFGFNLGQDHRQLVGSNVARLAH